MKKIDVEYTTPLCPFCHKPSVIKVRLRSLESWHRGTLIQDAFPNMAYPDRELLMTGTHPRCWKKHMGSPFFVRMYWRIRDFLGV